MPLAQQSLKVMYLPGSPDERDDLYKMRLGATPVFDAAIE